MSERQKSKLDTAALTAFASLFSLTASFAAPGDEYWDDRFDALGLNGPVSAIGVYGPNVYVGGAFTLVGDVPETNMARWDGSDGLRWVPSR